MPVSCCSASMTIPESVRRPVLFWFKRKQSLYVLSPISRSICNTTRMSWSSAFTEGWSMGSDVRRESDFAAAAWRFSFTSQRGV